MKWSDQHDITFAREILVSTLYETRTGSPERGKVWDKIAENLNKLESPKFHVSKRSLRDRLNLLMNRYQAKIREENLASGISPDEDEISTLLEEICEKEEECLQNPPSEYKKKKGDENKATAEEFRKKAMETVGETRKRRVEDGEERAAKRIRRSTSEAMEFLKEKAKASISLQKREFELRAKEQSNSVLLLEQQSKMHQDMYMLIQKQQQEQQK